MNTHKLIFVLLMGVAFSNVLLANEELIEKISEAKTSSDETLTLYRRCRMNSGDTDKLEQANNKKNARAWFDYDDVLFYIEKTNETTGSGFRIWQRAYGNLCRSPDRRPCSFSLTVYKDSLFLAFAEVFDIIFFEVNYEQLVVPHEEIRDGNYKDNVTFGCMDGENKQIRNILLNTIENFMFYMAEDKPQIRAMDVNDTGITIKIAVAHEKITFHRPLNDQKWTLVERTPSGRWGNRSGN